MPWKLEAQHGTDVALIIKEGTLECVTAALVKYVIREPHDTDLTQLTMWWVDSPTPSDEEDSN
jgi:cobalamin biosynthesis protein CobD/CbiB